MQFGWNKIIQYGYFSMQSCKNIIMSTDMRLFFNNGIIELISEDIIGHMGKIIVSKFYNEIYTLSEDKNNVYVFNTFNG